MLLKITPTTATTLESVGDINIANTDLQVVTIGQLQGIVNQLIENRQALENKINKIKIVKVKILLVKKFVGKKVKFKKVLT